MPDAAAAYADRNGRPAPLAGRFAFRTRECRLPIVAARACRFRYPQLDAADGIYIWMPRFRDRYLLEVGVDNQESTQINPAPNQPMRNSPTGRLGVCLVNAGVPTDCRARAISSGRSCECCRACPARSLWTRSHPREDAGYCFQGVSGHCVVISHAAQHGVQPTREAAPADRLLLNPVDVSQLHEVVRRFRPGS